MCVLCCLNLFIKIIYAHVCMCVCARICAFVGGSGFLCVCVYASLKHEIRTFMHFLSLICALLNCCTALPTPPHNKKYQNNSELILPASTINALLLQNEPKSKSKTKTSALPKIDTKRHFCRLRTLPSANERRDPTLYGSAGR